MKRKPAAPTAQFVEGRFGEHIMVGVGRCAFAAATRLYLRSDPEMNPSDRPFTKLIITNIITFTVFSLWTNGKVWSEGQPQSGASPSVKAPAASDGPSPRTEAAVRQYRLHCARCHGDDYAGHEGRK